MGTFKICSDYVFPYIDHQAYVLQGMLVNVLRSSSGRLNLWGFRKKDVSELLGRQNGRSEGTLCYRLSAITEP
jgi:hypothetical protein